MQHPSLILPQQKQILALMQRSGLKRLEETRGARIAPLQQRFGLGAQQVVLGEEKATQRLLDMLMGTEAGFLEAGVRRGQQLEDVAGARQFQEKMSISDWFNRFRQQQVSEAGVGRRQLVGIRAQKDITEMQIQAQKDVVEEQRKAQQKGIVAKLWSTVMDMFLGGIGTIGAGGMPFLGGLLGGVSGVGQFKMFEWLKGKGK